MTTTQPPRSPPPRRGVASGHDGAPAHRGHPRHGGRGGVGAVVVALNRLDDATPVAERCAATADGRTWYLSVTQADNAALITGPRCGAGSPPAPPPSGSRPRCRSRGSSTSTTATATPSACSSSAPPRVGHRRGDHGPRLLDQHVLRRARDGRGLRGHGGHRRRADRPTVRVPRRVRAARAPLARVGVRADRLVARVAHVRPRCGAHGGGAGGRRPDRAVPGARRARPRRRGPRRTVRRRDRGTVAVDASALPAAAEDGGVERSAWAVAQWAVATADATNVVAVEVGDRRWSRDGSTWTTPTRPTSPRSTRAPCASTSPSPTRPDRPPPACVGRGTADDERRAAHRG